MFLAAVSGGADSTALLAALASLRDRPPEAGFDLRVIHVEHGIRPAEESQGDADFVRDLCAALKVPYYGESIPPGKIAAAAKRRGIGIEAAARLYRRRVWFRQARLLEADSARRVWIVTAHTRDDMLETALMRIIRGAGPAGLAAMPARRGRILRPLLSLSRADVLCYLTEKNIAWREDSTNRDTRFFRNRIRHSLIPLLRDFFPRWQSGLTALAETQSLAAAFIRDEASRRIRWKTGKVFRTDAPHFFAQPPIIREEALFQAIDRLLAGRAASAPIRRIALRRFCQGNCQGFCQGSCPGSVNAVDLGPLRVLRKNSRIILGRKKSGVSGRGFALLIKAPGFYTVKGVTIEARSCFDSTEKADTVFFALLPLVIRPALRDDCIVKAGKKIAPQDAAKGPERERLLSAADRQGTAAFISSKGLLLRREIPADAVSKGFYMIVIKRSHNSTGGMNVQQSK